MKSRRIWHGLSTTMASLLVISIGAGSIANAHAMELNTRLGTSNYKLITSEGEEASDTDYFKSEFTELKDLIDEKNALAEEISEEGSVLLKNLDQTLPLDKNTDGVTLWGMNSHNPTLGGLIASSAAVNQDAGQKLYNIEAALEEKGFQLNQDMIDLYSDESVQGFARKNGHGLMPSFGLSYENPGQYTIGELPPEEYSDEVLESADDTAAVVVISRDCSEAADYSTSMESAVEGDSFERPLALSNYEKEMIALAKEHSTKVIVLLNTDNPVEIEELKQDEEIGAILWTGVPGVNGFLGVADVLSGEVNPSGHLPDTYAVNSASSPAMVSSGIHLYSNNSQVSTELTEENKADWYIIESEGIYTGYKYYETRYEDVILSRGNAEDAAGATAGNSWDYALEVSYPFGYGISYTTFEQKLNAVEVSVGGEGTAEVEVTNTGDVPGKSVVQLYVQLPYTEGGLEKASVQLIGFGKTQELEPGASETVTVSFDPKYMTSYDVSAEKENGTSGAYVLEAGEYYFTIGNGAHEAINNILAEKTGSEDGLIRTSDEEQIRKDNVKSWELDTTDMETYSVNVENALQDCDINNLIEGTVEYTTRSDWTKGWTSVEDITPTEEMMKALRNENYELTENGDGVVWGQDKGMQLMDLMLLDEEGQYAGVVPLDDARWDDLIDQITLEEAMAFLETGGEMLTSIKMPDTFRNDGPVGFAYDQVGGYFVRWTENLSEEATYVAETDEGAGYSLSTMPTEPVVAATFNTELVKREGELMGEDGLWANENSILAPALNLHRNPYCARNHEYYSEDAMLTNIMGVELCIGGTSKGLMMEPKHYAFNHQELNRTGVSTFFDEQAGRENELRAFQGVCQNNAAQGLMTGFNRAGACFVGAHEGLQVQILRNEWGFTGWIATDMINGADYMNWRDVIYGGGGVCLTDSAYESSNIGVMPDSVELIKKDTEFQLCMKKALKYWTYNCLASNLMNGYQASSDFVYVLTWWQKGLIGVDIVFGVMMAFSILMYLLSFRKKGGERA